MNKETAFIIDYLVKEISLLEVKVNNNRLMIEGAAKRSYEVPKPTKRGNNMEVK
jgi:hypothetical protein